MFLWTLVPGDTIDLKHVAKLEPISYTATCSSVVDVMFVSSHEILPQKDSSAEPLLDKETIGKLVERWDGSHSMPLFVLHPWELPGPWCLGL